MAPKKKPLKMPGIKYTQHEGFAAFEVPVPPPAPDDHYRIERLGWTPFEYCTWATGNPEYPIVTSSCGQDEIWFPSRADYVAYVHQYAAPVIALRDIEFELERIRHGQHAPGGDASNCTTCEDIESDAAMIGDEGDTDENALPPVVRPLGKHRP